VGSDESVRIVEQFLAAFNRHRLDQLIRLTTADQSLRLPDGTAARGRLGPDG
jgi:limonene-1,2-epoxide hydrolase